MRQEVGYYRSPIGPLRIVVMGVNLIGIDFVEKIKESDSSAMLDDVLRQLNEYFLGVRKVFDVNLDLVGTNFQKQAWQRLINIPYGETLSYQEQARSIGYPKAYRAIGNANGKNPITIIVPCHRVLTSTQEIGGYSSGIHRKKWLLEHEQRFK